MNFKLLLIILFLSNISFGQEIEGYVSGPDDKPLIAARIIDSKKKLIVKSDSLGEFKFNFWN